MYIANKQIADIVKLLANYKPSETKVLFIGEGSDLPMSELIKELGNENVLFFGAIFPKVISDGIVYDEGIVVETFSNINSIELIDISKEKKIVIPQRESNSLSVFTFVDGLSANVATYLSALYDQHGNNISYFGGGAGSLSLVQAPCVFDKTGIYQDSAILAYLGIESNLGVSHGWKELKGPIIATKTERNVIKELNWRPAFTVYKETIEEHVSERIIEDNFFSVAKKFPFGLQKDYDEDIVRDPISVLNGTELLCVGEVPENVALNILKGSKSSLIDAAQSAVDKSIEKSNGDFNKAIIIDCISRILFLEDDISKEMSVISESIKLSQKDVTIKGALTLGEISSYGNGFLEFFNKTIVIGVFKDE